MKEISLEVQTECAVFKTEDENLLTDRDVDAKGRDRSETD